MYRVSGLALFILIWIDSGSESKEEIFKIWTKISNIINQNWEWLTPDPIEIKVNIPHTGKSFSEALIHKSINPQYDDRLCIELPFQYMKIPSL